MYYLYTVLKVGSTTTSRPTVELPDIAERGQYVTGSKIPQNNDKKKQDVEQLDDNKNTSISQFFRYYNLPSYPV